MIECRHIDKTYRVYKRPAGLKSAVRALFSRKYEIVRALNDVSFTVRDGEMVGYIGPNGAGKSTTIKILCGILTPDRGECVIDGLTPRKDRTKHVSRIGVVFGQRSQLWWDVPVIDSFEILRDMYRVDQALYEKNLDELTALLNLSEILKTPTRNLSLGQRMRCEIAASLIAVPASGVHWSFDKAITLFLMVFCGAAVFFSFFLLKAACAFFTVESLDFMNLFTYGARQFGKYPFSAYGDGVLKFLTYIIPLALIQYYPLLYLIERENGAFYMLAPLLSSLFLIPCVALFRLGVRHYKSTGS